MLLLDGGFGGEMDRRLQTRENDDPAWCARYHERYPDLTKTVHEDFVDAGSQIITANTYSVLAHLLQYTDAQVAHSVREAVCLARAVSKSALVAGSLSGHGFQTFGVEETKRGIRVLASALKDANIDCVMVEMVQTEQLGREMVTCAERTGLPMFVGFSVIRSTSGSLVLRGETQVRFTGKLVADILGDVANVVAVGVMHTDVALIPEALQEIKQGWSGSLMAYPDHGTFTHNKWMEGHEANEQSVLEAMIQLVVQEPKMRVVGGCCGLGPCFIRALKRRLACEAGVAFEDARTFLLQSTKHGGVESGCCDTTL